MSRQHQQDSGAGSTCLRLHEALSPPGFDLNDRAVESGLHSFSSKVSRKSSEGNVADGNKAPAADRRGYLQGEQQQPVAPRVDELHHSPNIYSRLASLADESVEEDRNPGVAPVDQVSV
jgi:hypothetical protein